MSATILPFTGSSSQNSPLVDVLRIGTNGHRQIEDLVSSGRIRNRFFVVEASAIGKQSDLIRILREEGAFVILDTNVAEMEASNRMTGALRHLPWAPDGLGVPLDISRFD